MLTEAWVSGTYRQYKQDTDYLIDWLSKTAIQCGYDIKNLAKSHSKNQSSQKYEVSAQEIKAQARLVAHFKKPPVTVPALVLKANKDAIESRKEVSGWYSNIPSKNHASDRGHQLFISTLETVLATLQSIKTEKPGNSLLSDKKQNLKTNVSSTTTPKVNQTSNFYAAQNKFSSLKIEESEPGHNKSHSSAPRTKNTKPNTTPSSVRFEAKISAEEENHFALACFLKDITDMRKYLRSVWTDYKSGKLSLIVASTVTNLAISAVKDMEQDFSDRSDDLADIFCITSLEDLTMKGGEERFLKTLKAITNLSSPDLVEFQDVVKLLTIFRMQYFHAISDSIEPPDRRKSNYGPDAYPLYRMMYPESILGKLRKEQRTLCNILMDYSGVHAYHTYGGSFRYEYASYNEDIAEDMISLGLRDCLEKPKISMWTAFGCRIFLDTTSLLGKSSKTPYREMLTEIDRLDLAMKLKTPSGDLRTWMACPTCATCGTKELRRANYHTKTLIGQATSGCFKDLMLGTCFCESDDEDSDSYDGVITIDVEEGLFSYFERNMLCCGTISLAMVMDFEMIGIEFERHIAAIQLIAHLYHASRLLESIEVPSIPELNSFIQRQGYLLFGTATPTTFKASYDCLLRSLSSTTPGIARSKVPERFTPSSTRTIRPNRTFHYLRQHYNGEISLRTVLANLLAQRGYHNTVTETTSKCEASNLITVLEIARKQLSNQLPELTKVDYCSLANKCIWALTMIRTKLNHAFGDKYALPFDESKENKESLAMSFTMVANVLQGAGESIDGQPLTSIGYRQLNDSTHGQIPRKHRAGHSHSHRHHKHDKSHDLRQRNRNRNGNGSGCSSFGDASHDHELTDADRLLLANGESCTHCGPSELRTALDVLGKVWAFKQKEDED